MKYSTILSNFKDDYDAYKQLKSEDSPDTPKVSDKDGDKKIIKWVLLFENTLSRTFSSKESLSYIIRGKSTVQNENDDPLEMNKWYGESGSLMSEVIKRLPHEEAIYKDDNKSVFIMISKAVTGTSVESTIKSFSEIRVDLRCHEPENLKLCLMNRKTNCVNGKDLVLERKLSRRTRRKKRTSLILKKKESSRIRKLLKTCFARSLRLLEEQHRYSLLYHR